MTGSRPCRRGKSVQPGRGEKRGGEPGKGVDTEAIAERPAGNGAESGERDQDARFDPGAGRNADSDHMGEQRTPPCSWFVSYPVILVEAALSGDRSVREKASGAPGAKGSSVAA
jgi:hypothetical protein